MRTKIAEQAMILYEGGFKISEIIRILPYLYPTKSKENIEMIIASSIEMTKSLMIATDQAGGSGWGTSELCKMTVIELISALAPNHVRFVYTKTKLDGEQKLKEIKNFAKGMIKEFKEDLKMDKRNIVAATGLGIYKEIIEIIQV